MKFGHPLSRGHDVIVIVKMDNQSTLLTPYLMTGPIHWQIASEGIPLSVSLWKSVLAPETY